MAKSKFHQLQIDFSCSSHNTIQETTSRILLEYFQLVLYQRSQIPEPVQIIQRKIQRQKRCNDLSAKNNRKNSKESQYVKRCKQLLKSVEELKVCIDELVQKCDDIEAVVIIGPTAVSTKEAFAFKTTREDLPENHMVHDKQVIDSHARKFCMLMVQAPLYGPTELALTNTRLFVRAQKTTLAGLKPWPNFRYPVQKKCLSVEVNFKNSTAPVSVLSDSFISSTERLNVVASSNESGEVELLPLYSPERLNSSSSSDDQQSEDKYDIIKSSGINDDLSESKGSIRGPVPIERPRRLSAIEVLNAVLAGDDLPTPTGDDENEAAGKENNINHACDSSTMWFEVPVVIRGFKF